MTISAHPHNHLNSSRCICIHPLRSKCCILNCHMPMFRDPNIVSHTIQMIQMIPMIQIRLVMSKFEINKGADVSFLFKPNHGFHVRMQHIHRTTWETSVVVLDSNVVVAVRTECKKQHDLFALKPKTIEGNCLYSPANTQKRRRIWGYLNG